MKFNIHFLPARYGDSIWIEYGPAANTRRILIDGGTSGTKKDIKEMLETVPADKRHFELLVISHVDRDHIEGILALLEEESLSFTVDDIWFNGWDHLPADGTETLGALQGERLSAAILKHKLKWNKAFGNKAVMIPAGGVLPVIPLAGGMELVLLSPGREQLVALRPQWEKEVKEEGLIPGFGLVQPQAAPGEETLGPLPDVDVLNEEKFHEDDSLANGSSIAFLARFAGKQVLFAADSYPGVILEGLTKLYPGKAPVDLFKLSHHGSAHNTSPALIEKCDCNRYFIPTSGARFHHPAAVTMARVIKRGGPHVQLLFNYRSADNKVWDSGVLKLKHKYKAFYPDDGQEGMMVEV